MSNFLKKYHAYIVAFIAFVTAAVQVVFGIDIPGWVYELEAAVGIGAVRVTLAQVGSTSGWKTYVLAAGLGVTAALRAFGVPVPAEVDAMIGALATGSLAAGVKKVS